MWWVALWSLVTLVGTVGIVASTNSVRFSRRVTREAAALLTTATEARRIDHRTLGELPAPVRRYLMKAVGRRERGIRTVRLRHGGTFRPSLDGRWLPIRGSQYFSAGPPGFIWWGRARMGPGFWIDARDRSVGAVGNMLVSAESTVTLAHSTGPQLDQGALLRLIGEMTWFPSAFLDDRYVGWSAIDDHRATATLTVSGHAVSGEFAFGPDDFPVTFTAERYRDVGGGQAMLTTFRGQSTDFVTSAACSSRIAWSPHGRSEIAGLNTFGLKSSNWNTT